MLSSSDDELTTGPISPKKRTKTRDTTETNSSINYLFSQIPTGTKSKNPSKKKSEKKQFEELAAKIERDNKLIETLRAENRALRAEIARCEHKIHNYPEMKKKYDMLSSSLSQIAESRSQIRSPK